MGFNFHGDDFSDSLSFFVLGYITKSTVMICPSVKICDFLGFFFTIGVSTVSEKRKKEKRTPLGHWSLASRPCIRVRHVSDTGTSPKMACWCNLA